MKYDSSYIFKMVLSVVKGSKRKNVLTTEHNTLVVDGSQFTLYFDDRKNNETQKIIDILLNYNLINTCGDVDHRIFINY